MSRPPSGSGDNHGRREDLLCKAAPLPALLARSEGQQARRVLTGGSCGGREARELGRVGYLVNLEPLFSRRGGLEDGGVAPPLVSALPPRGRARHLPWVGR